MIRGFYPNTIQERNHLNSIEVGCSTDDIDEIRNGLEGASSIAGYDEQKLLAHSVRRAVRYTAPRVVQFLLERGAPLDSITPWSLYQPWGEPPHASTDVIQRILDHGWDINQRDPDQGAGPGMRLLQHVCGDEALVRWCLDRGASVVDEDPDPYKSPPLLEIAASVGTVSTFALLHARGAKLGPRVLHRSVQSAAGPSQDPEHRSARMAVVKYLVEDLGLDVNAMDTDGQLPNHWGTPISYAAHLGSDCEEVIRFLLDQGADPLIKDCWGLHSAYSRAEYCGNNRVINLLARKL